MTRKAAEPEGGVQDGVVGVRALRNYRELVVELGGDPDELLDCARIPSDALDQKDGFVSYRAMIQLLERSSAELECPDFGLKLAAKQGGISVLGPLAIAMSNSRTVGEAYRYCSTHLQVYGSMLGISMETDPQQGRSFMRFEILLGRVPQQRQTVENALGLTHLAVLALSGGKFGAREVWFEHPAPALPSAFAQEYFGCPLNYGKPFNAVFFATEDLAQPVVNQNPELYELASSFIELRFPAPELLLATHVRVVAARLLARGHCEQVKVAAALGMHPRTLQRRLREEGTYFEAILDSVRQDAAYRYLRDSNLPLSKVADLLGYSEPSVLTRSCQRWFSCSPRDLRRGHSTLSSAA